MPQAFVIRPFGTKKDSSGNEINFEKVHNELIGPAITSTGLGGGTTGKIIDAGNIREDMFALILEADIIICDITIHNANVFYELGIRHALRKTGTILIKGGPTDDDTPFDILTDRYLYYEVADPADKLDDLVATIQATQNSSRETDSPIFKMLPALPEADPEKVQVVPGDFLEEVERARAKNARGWLRLLAREVRPLRFERQGIKLVGQALWKVQDFEAAKNCFEHVLQTLPDDIESNLALANVYERLSRSEKDPTTYLNLSNQALDRVARNSNTTQSDMVEAMSLKGRNMKTMWKHTFRGAGNLEDRREAAFNMDLVDSYKAYAKAFDEDLNHFYSGLAALQTAFIVNELINGNDDWEYIFADDEEAGEFKKGLDAGIAAYMEIVPASINRSLKKLSRKDDNWIWAKISECDMVFMKEPNEKRVVKRYTNVIKEKFAFSWNAAKGQLILYETLGIKAKLARNIIDEVEKKITQQEAETEKPLHIIMFAGHVVDRPDRAEPRFPPDKEDDVRNLIEAEIKAVLDEDHRYLGLSSGAPGGDIIFQELCASLEVSTYFCIPFPKAEYSKEAYDVRDAWRSRFLKLAHDANVMELSHTSGLPRWLHGSALNPWERGNNWVMEMALAADASKRTLIALWDKKDHGDSHGGTAHMVKLARDAGVVDVRIIDANQLIT